MHTVVFHFTAVHTIVQIFQAVDWLTDIATPKATPLAWVKSESKMELLK